MRLLITPALRLTPEQKAALEAEHTLYFLEDERIPLDRQALSFDPAAIEGIVCNFFFLHNPLTALPNLRFVQLTSAGLDRVPLEQLRQKGISVCNAGATYAIPMAEWALCRILEICKCAGRFQAHQRDRQWQKERSILELSGKTAAIVGFGNVGRQIGRRLSAFDVQIRAVDILPDASGISSQWYPISQLRSALAGADIVVLTLPLTEQTRHILNRQTFSWLEDHAILVNVARGGLICEDALLEALDQGKLLGAALDVFETEPLPRQSRLWDQERVLISPHNSFVGEGNSRRLFAQIRENLKKESLPQ